jgi:ComF family protein
MLKPPSKFPILHSIADATLNLVFPPVCQICQKQRAESKDGYICGGCWAGIRFLVPPFCDRCGLPYDGAITQTFVCENCAELKFRFSHARSAVHANNFILDIIHRYKYSHALWFETFLADLLVREAAPQIAAQNWDLIVPVPLYSVKKREREFNQAAQLARHLGRATGLPVAEGLVRRSRPTPTQTNLSRPQRAENVHGAFEYCGREKLNGQKVIVIDDVLTTGATTSAVAGALRKGGAKDVCVWTVARGT